jgi:NAD(P)-dependent dehydrogenase (short-subunit alcohol dehydrogenase family)
MRALVTGASGAIGAATCAALRGRGATVVGLDLHADPADGDVIACDIRDDEQVRAAVAEAIERLGGLDVLVNNAGIGDAHDAGAAPDARAEAVVDVNLFGAWRVTGAAMPSLLESGGRVVNVSSGLAVVNVPLAAAYSASKRGIAAWADALRLEYLGRLEAVTTVYPGYIRTPIHDAPAERGVSLEGMVPAEPLALTVRAIVRSCTGRPRRDVPSSPGVAVAMRASRIAPGLVDRIVARRTRRQVRAGSFADAVVAQGLRETAQRR